jgi:diguanylate cyclase (GGDEF)-like protein
MQRSEILNRLFTVLIFAIVASLSVFGYGSLVLDAKNGDAAQSDFLWYDAYRTLDDRAGMEINANVRWAANPGAQTWQAAVAAQRTFDATLANREREATSAPDRATLASIARTHHAAVDAAWRVMRLQVARNRSAGSLYGALVIPLYEELSRQIETAATTRQALAQVVSARWKNLEHVLELMMIAIGLLGVAMLSWLTTTVRTHRRRTEMATESEMRRLEAAALSDSLTSLGNHRAFREDLAKELARSRRHGQTITLALVDIDDFKALNDSRGHAHGDEVLVDTARALDSGRREDRAYRVGGDEFALIFVEASGDDAEVALERLRARLKARIGTATASIGYCQLEDAFDENDLYERADAALYAAKRRGRNSMVSFANIRENTTVFTSRKTAALNALLERRLIHVAFQPIWSLVGNDILGFEALARPDPDLGFSGPQELFDIAERQRRIGELDRLCIELGLGAAIGLASNHMVFLNVTPETLGRADFDPAKLAAQADAAGIETRQVVIEVTERRIVSPDELLQSVVKLRELGFLIALDDTGAGYAGLEVLSKFTFDFVKIDRVVVAEASKQRRARGVLAGIVAIAREGGSYVIAEGVETIEQLEFLKDLRPPSQALVAVSGVQGYLLGRPARCAPEAEEFAAYGRILEGPRTVAS